MSWIVKVGKQGKKIVKKLITPAEKHYVGYFFFFKQKTAYELTR